MANEVGAILVTNLDDVELKPGVRYAHPSSPRHWFAIEAEPDDEYSVGVYKGPFASSSINNGDYIVTWKTFKGAVRFIKRQAVDPNRQHHRLFSQYEAPSEQAKYDGRLRVIEEKRAQWAADREEREDEARWRFGAARSAEERGLVALRDAGLEANISEQGHNLLVELGDDTFQLSWVEPR